MVNCLDGLKNLTRKFYGKIFPYAQVIACSKEICCGFEREFAAFFVESEFAVFWVTLFKVITSKVSTKLLMLSTINNKQEIYCIVKSSNVRY